MPSDIHEQLLKYLADAHSIEEQALTQLRAAPGIAGDDQIAAAFREHLTETEGHERRVRELLDARDSSPSRFKDLVMAAGGMGFVWFARLQPDTPGKLVAHALSYEALEYGSYELLHRVAALAGEDDVAAAAREISGQEQAMMRRLEGSFDRSVAASLADHQPDDLTEQLRKYLADAHALEKQAEQLLQLAPKNAGSAELEQAYADHLEETRTHATLVEHRLEALGGSPSTLKDAAMRMGAINWAGFFSAHPDTPGKLAAFAHAFEYLEIGGYEQLRRVAERAGDRETVELADLILRDERAAAGRLASLFDAAAAAALEAQGVSA